MASLEPLMGKVRKYQDEELANSRRRRLAVRNRLLAQSTRSSGRSPWTRAFWGRGAAALGALAIATLSVLMWLGPKHAPTSPLTFAVASEPRKAGEFFSVPEGEPLELSFSDGSTVELGEQTGARVDNLSAEGAEIQLEQGSAEVAVVHRSEDTAWKVHSGPYTVHVVGTKFRVAWDSREQVFELQMHEGRVIVEGPDFDARSFGPGETLRIGPAEDERPKELTDNTESEQNVAEPKAKTAEQTERKTRAPRSLKHLMRSGTLEDLKARATQARRSGDPRERDVHLAIRRRFHGTPAASNAAFHLARYEARWGATGASEQWLRTSLEEAPNGPWAGDAAGRLIELMYASGGHRRVQARKLAEEYRHRYPRGSYEAYARRIANE